MQKRASPDADGVIKSRPARQRESVFQPAVSIVSQQSPLYPSSLLTMEGRANLHAVDVKPEVQLAHVTAIVDKRVRVILQQQVLQHVALAHEPKQVVVAPAGTGQRVLTHWQKHAQSLSQSCPPAAPLRSGHLMHLPADSGMGPYAAGFSDCCARSLQSHAAAAPEEHVQPHLDVIVVLVLEGRDLAADEGPLLVNVHLVSLWAPGFCFRFWFQFVHSVSGN